MGEDRDERRKGVIRTALLLGLLALGVYVAFFIAMGSR